MKNSIDLSNWIQEHWCYIKDALDSIIDEDYMLVLKNLISLSKKYTICDIKSKKIVNELEKSIKEDELVSLAFCNTAKV